MENSPKKNIKSDVASREEEILEYWENNKIFEKTLLKNKGEKEFVFYDGPPFATGLPHYGHILPGTIKDVIPRFKTMQGMYVRRQWGWDCHGLPIENLVEKELGLKSKKDILDFGIGAFNQQARSKIMLFADDWKRIIPRTGRFVDMEHDYKTMDTSYTESVWWAFKTLYDKGLIYEGFKSMQICPRCETTLSNFEVNQGYKDITDISVYVKFELKDEPGTYLLAWTTTPWTLPGNVALAINEKTLYVKAKKDQIKVILAKELVEKVLKDNYEIIEEFSGKKLLGKGYKPVFDYYKDEKLENKERAWKVYGADFVTTEDGTGIVHIAPAFGSDDYKLSLKEKLPFIQHVFLDGTFKKEVVDFKGQSVKPKDDPSNTSGQDHQKADIEIIKNLAHRGLLFAKEKIIHSYPHCWRCETPLLNYATSSWFLKVTEIKEKLIRENKKVKWVPEHVKEGRFGKWLEGAHDWAISRSRFWGAPLPVWKCDKCKHIEVLGSLSEMRKRSNAKNTYYVMRHGESESNILEVMSSDPNLYGLTEKGKKQVIESVKKFKNEGIDLIITSPFKRTRETAKIVKEFLGLSNDALITESLIHEINAGIFDGKPLRDYRIYASHHSRFTQAPPDGESQLDVKKRMGDFLYNLERRYQGKKILIITHDSPAWLLFAAGEGATAERAYELHDNKDYFLKNAEVRLMPFTPLPHNLNYEIDLHRPYIDDFMWTCSCGGKMGRIPEIFDTWFDSGSMPFAEFHYPFEKSQGKSFPNLFNPVGGFFSKTKGFPADFIAEGLDQTRGWFYTLLVLSVALFNRSPFKTVVVNGLILAEDGRKMSKSLNNYPDPMHIMNKYCADALRLYMMGSPLVHGEEVNFREEGVDEIYKKNILRLRNVVSFYEMYASKEKITNYELRINILDQWIVARLNDVIASVTASLEKYELDKAVPPIVDFIDDFSTWYLRRSRDRFKSDDKDDISDALSTTRHILLELAKVIAPFTPFLSEDIYKRVKGEKESIHMESWPKVDSRIQNLDSRIIEDMREIRKIVSLGLEVRSKANIKVRQPLRELRIKNDELRKENNQQLLELIKEEVNVKEVVFDNNIQNEVELDLTISPELAEEGDARELIRAIQDLRKKKGLTIDDLVVFYVETDVSGKSLIEKYSTDLMKVTNLKKIEFKTFSALDITEIKIRNIIYKIDL